MRASTRLAIRIVSLSVVVVLLFLVRASHSPSPALGQTQNLLTCTTVPKLFAGFLSNHLNTRELTPAVKKRTIDNFLKYLDSSKTLLLESEVRRITRSLESVFMVMRVGDCSEIQKVHQLLIKRAKTTEDHVRKYISNPKYKLDEKVELVMDPDKRGYARTQKERLRLVEKFLHFQMSNYLESGTKFKEAKRRLIHRYELITKRFRDQQLQDILPSFLNSFALALDPHSGYFSPDDLEDFKISMGLSLEGIGASLTWRDGYTVVEEVIPGGAADRTKTLQPKDKIIAVKQESEPPVDVIDMELRKVVRLIRGKKGTPVTLTVLRQGEKTERFTTKIIRDKIDLKEQAAKVTYKEIKSGDRKLKLAILDLPSFYGDNDRKRSSYNDVKRLLEEIKKNKADGLLLDLSRNGGGLLDDAVRISGLFLKTGAMVATQLARKNPEVLQDKDEAILYSGPMIVLTSRLSASASEILAGAMKDYGRAIIVGDDHSFGKGTVQSVLHLPPGLGAVKVTTGMFFRPGGQSTQHRGVLSDIVIPSRYAIDEIGEKTLDYSISSRKIEKFLSESANTTDPEMRWKPVKESLVKKLRKNSQKRVAQSKEFKEIRKQLKEARKKKDIIRLADVRSEKKDTGPKKKSRKEKAEQARAPQIEEALNILTDYVVASTPPPDLVTKN